MEGGTLMPTDSDKERARRIRAQQLSARDPGDSKIPGYNWNNHYKKKRKMDAVARYNAQRPLVIELWEALPPRWKGLLAGFLLGTIVGMFVIFLLPEDLRFLILIPQLIGMVMGMIVGKSMQDDPAKP